MWPTTPTTPPLATLDQTLSPKFRERAATTDCVPNTTNNNNNTNHHNTTPPKNDHGSKSPMISGRRFSETVTKFAPATPEMMRRPSAPLAPNFELLRASELLHHPDTTRREIRGWYMYDFANGAFFFCALLFLPVLITSQAAVTAKKKFCETHTIPFDRIIANHTCREYGWAKNFADDGECFGAGSTCGNNGPKTNASCVDQGGEWSATWRDDAIGVTLFGVPEVGYASVSLVCTSASVILQLIAFLLFGSLADFGSNRKKMFMITNTVGAVSCLLLLAASDDSLFWFSGLMLIVSNVSYGSAVIFYNAYLPLLVSAHPKVRQLETSGAPKEELEATLKYWANHMSSMGFATGFVGQIIVLSLCLGVFALLGSDQDKLAIRINCAFSGLWTFVFGGYTFYVLQTRPSAPFPEGQNMVSTSLLRIRTTFKSCKTLPQLFIFLLAYFLYSDATGTIAASAAIFATIELQMTAFQIMLGVLMVSFGAVFSCVFFFAVHKRFGVSEKAILIFSLLILGLLPIYGLVGLRCQWEFYLMSTIYGLVYGSEQAFTRSLFSRCIPTGHEAEYFSLFEVTDKGTAWLGPIVVAAVFSATGSFRLAFVMLAGFFILGIAVLLFFHPERAERQRLIFELAEKQSQEEAANKVAPPPPSPPKTVEMAKRGSAATKPSVTKQGSFVKSSIQHGSNSLGEEAFKLKILVTDNVETDQGDGLCASSTLADAASLLDSQSMGDQDGADYQA